MVGNDVGRQAAFADDAVDAGVVSRLLAQQADGRVCNDAGIQGVDALRRGTGRMGRFAVEDEHHRPQRKRSAALVMRVRCRMIHDHGIDVRKRPVCRVIHLGAAGLLGRRTHDDNAAADLRQFSTEDDAGRHGSTAQHIVTASVADDRRRNAHAQHALGNIPFLLFRDGEVLFVHVDVDESRRHIKPLRVDDPHSIRKILADAGDLSVFDAKLQRKKLLLLCIDKFSVDDLTIQHRCFHFVLSG